MSYHSGDTFQQPSCTTIPLGKSVRRALRAAIGMPKPKKKKKPPGGKDDGPSAAGSSSMICSSLSKEEAAARKESVVRVVLSSGVVEVYPCVVLACAVIRRHPPGLCLAHPDVFRNPHGALLRPLEPLFPGQKVLLIPWSTVVKLKQRIPESSIGAFDDTAGSEEATSSSSTETEAQDQDGSGGAGDEAAATAGDGSSGGFMPACSARDYFEARERWSACRFRRLVEQGIAVEPSTDVDDDHQPTTDLQRKGDKKKGKTKKKKKKKKGKKKGHKTKRTRERRPAGPAAGLISAFATQRRTWAPTLPSVEEEEDHAVSPASTDDVHESSKSPTTAAGY